MRRNLLIALLIFLFIGGCDWKCGKGPTTYWEVDMFTISNERFDGEKRVLDIKESSFEDLEIVLEFAISKVASISFNMNRLYALDCSDPAYIRNSLASIDIITVFDINDDYLAGTNINEIVTLDRFNIDEIIEFEPYELHDFFGIGRVFMSIAERILPEQEFSLDITIKFSDGKVLNQISDPIMIIN